MCLAALGFLILCMVVLLATSWRTSAAWHHLLHPGREALCEEGGKVFLREASLHVIWSRLSFQTVYFIMPSNYMWSGLWTVHRNPLAILPAIQQAPAVRRRQHTTTQDQTSVTQTHVHIRASQTLLTCALLLLPPWGSPKKFFKSILRFIIYSSAFWDCKSHCPWKDKHHLNMKNETQLLFPNLKYLIKSCKLGSRVIYRGVILARLVSSRWKVL